MQFLTWGILFYMYSTDPDRYGGSECSINLRTPSYSFSILNFGKYCKKIMSYL